jgi:hypothetical protein
VQTVRGFDVIAEDNGLGDDARAIVVALDYFRSALLPEPSSRAARNLGTQNPHSDLRPVETPWSKSLDLPCSEAYHGH